MRGLIPQPATSLMDSVALVKLGPDTVQVVQPWQVLAVDGADVSAAQQQRLVRAQRQLSAGMTMDLSVVMPRETGYALRLRMDSDDTIDAPTRAMLAPLMVRADPYR
ncbi:MAG: hypothetical protein HEQ38_01485 [Gemmatimonas sp.]|nr:hypothetical protein [Gemmatimonas sp.]